MNMDMDKTLFLMCMVWYFYTYGVPIPLINYYIRHFYYKFTNLFLQIQSQMNKRNEQITDKNDSNLEEEIKISPKYEDKYILDIRKLNKEWILTEDEVKQKESLTEEFYGGSLDTIRDDIYEITQQINNFKKEMEEDTDTINYVENCNEEGDDLIDETTLEERNEYRMHQIEELNSKINELNNKINTQDGLNELRCNAEKNSHDHIINKRREKLKNCYVMEKTPQGNVLMIYNIERESFTYYSDSTIPYRYLEVVGRKYVKMFGCRPIFVDMEEELRLFEEKWEKEQEMKKMKEDEEKKKLETPEKNNQVNSEPKKSVFAKFKSYNKDAGGKISMAPPPKNSIPSKTVSESKENEKIILKERANRYTYEGKLSNFNFLQKIDKKVFNKKLGFTFADFKKMSKK
jgi:hypothetical protein